MSLKKLAEKRANDFRVELAALLKKHNANFNLDLNDSRIGGVEFTFDINETFCHSNSDSYENKLVDFQSGEVCADDISRSIV